VAQNFSYSGYGNAPVVAGTLGQVFGDIQKRKISAVQGTPINSAGAQFVNELGQARALQGTLGNVFQIGGIISGMGGLGGAAPTEAAPQLGGGKMTQAPINWS
jgi:hypothetical protein